MEMKNIKPIKDTFYDLSMWLSGPERGSNVLMIEGSNPTGTFFFFSRFPKLLGPATPKSELSGTQELFLSKIEVLNYLYMLSKPTACHAIYVLV